MQAATNNPGSAGGYKATWTQFDSMGRVSRQYNPTEIDGNWNPYGDDVGGALYTQQTYDWKGRPLVTTNQDGTQKYASYTGCGCAGGEVVTLTDEVGRQQKVYSDVVGRQSKTEVLNWNGTVYSAAVNTLDGLDHITNVRQWSGPENGGGAYQDTTMVYDGYGRMQRKHMPEQQDQYGNPTYTTWAYSNDDTVYSVSDARGATCTYGYNNRHQVTSATHVLAGQPTIASTFGYDAAGNRTLMNDSLGSTTYIYDAVSRMSSETRTFAGLGSYTLSYSYNLANELTSITDPFGAQVVYNHDAIGRTATVTGSGFLNVSSYASNIQYRAWGGQKSITYGDGGSATTTYDSRMQPASYNFPGLRETYQLYADGRLQQMNDLDDRNQDVGYPDTARHFSRAMTFDHAGRITHANGVGSSGLPFNQGYNYDAFDNTTSRAGYYYYQGYKEDDGTFQNNRRQDFNYDLDGNAIHTPTYAYNGGPIAAYRDWTYDASGNMAQVRETITSNSSVSTYVSGYDGDGQLALEYYQENPNTTKSYIVRSSVLNGQAVTRLDYLGNKSTTNFTIDGQLIAVQFAQTSYLRWEHIDPLRLSEAGDTKPVYDPLGNYVVWQNAPTGPPPNAYPPSAAWAGGIGPSFGYAINTACNLDGIPTDCNLAFGMVAHGSAQQCPTNDCGPYHFDGSDGGEGGWMIGNGSGGALVSNGSGSYWFDPDDPIYVGTPQDAAAMFFVPRKGSRTRRARRVHRSIPSSGGDFNLSASVFRQQTVQDPPRSLGYIDLNFGLGLPNFVGITCGLILTEQRACPYIGGGAMTPGPSGLISYSPDGVSGGTNGQLQVGPISIGQDAEGNSFQEYGVPIGRPSASATVFYVFNAPHPVHRPGPHRRDFNAAINGTGPPQSSRNCACNRH
jgi:YD repeat-containing protein